MYVGTLIDFFYKSKKWVETLPKHKNKRGYMYLNINNRIFRINNLTGEINLIVNNKKNNLITNINNKNKIISRNHNNIYFRTDNSSKSQDTELNEYTNRTLNRTTINKKNKINNLKTNFFRKTISNIKESRIRTKQKIEKDFKKNIFPYFKKPPIKYSKPKIAFGKKMDTEISKKRKINLKNNEKNSFMTIYKQHMNNMLSEGKNDKIYFPTKEDNIIMKSFREQILKEKVNKELSNKFKFFLSNNNILSKVPNLSPINFEFYSGYSISDNNRERNIFFRNIYKRKKQEKTEFLDNNS